MAALEKDQDPQAAEAKGSHFPFPIHVLTHFMTCEATTSMVLNEALGYFVDAPRRNESTGLRTTASEAGGESIRTALPSFRSREIGRFGRLEAGSNSAIFPGFLKPSSEALKTEIT